MCSKYVKLILIFRLNQNTDSILFVGNDTEFFSSLDFVKYLFFMQAGICVNYINNLIKINIIVFK